VEERLMILVTHPTGNVGSALLPQLVEADAAVRALAHSPAIRRAIERHGAEAVDGDFDLPETLEAAMVGCDHLFLLSPVRPDQPAREKAAIDAAGRAGVGHVVALSVMGSDRSSSVPFGRWHAEIDDHLVASGLDYTILRPSAFMQVHLLPVETVKAQSRWYGMTGDGATAYVDAGDVAAAAAVTLTSTGHTGRTYELTGPEAISIPQAAAQLSEAIRRDVVYIDVPADQFRANLADAGMPDWLADALVALYTTIREGHAATVTNSIEELTGRRARSYREFVEDHKDRFATG
jgi:uncharacterized protein YbjT (DUF2867 family)